MQDWEQLDEIDSLGEEEDPQELETAAGEVKSGGLSTVPLFQAALCALALAALAYMRFTGHPAYDKIAARYHAEQAQQIDLPKLSAFFQVEAGAQPSGSPAPTPAPTPSKGIELIGPGAQQL